MINLRYHVVSLTAVFLAIGIGIAFGASMVNRATVVVLQRNFDDQAVELDAAIDARTVAISELQKANGRADTFESESRSRLLTGHIVETPVLAIAATGTSPETIAAFDRVALDSESRYAGLIEFTDRVGLDRPSDQDKLRNLLNRDLEPDELRALLIERVGQILLAATREEPEPDPDLTIPIPPTTIPPTPTTVSASETGATTSTTDRTITSLGSTTTTSTTVSEEALRREAAESAQTSFEEANGVAAIEAVQFFEALEREGFLTYRRSRARTLEAMLTPDTGARVVVLSDEGALDTPALWIEELVRFMASDGVVGVVVAQPEVIDPDAVIPDGEEESDDEEAADIADDVEPVDLPVHDLVGRLRRDAEIADRLSTISHIDSFEGQVAVVFALEDLPDRVGHYGPEAETNGLVPDDSP